MEQEFLLKVILEHFIAFLIFFDINMNLFHREKLFRTSVASC